MQIRLNQILLILLYTLYIWLNIYSLQKSYNTLLNRFKFIIT